MSSTIRRDFPWSFEASLTCVALFVTGVQVHRFQVQPKSRQDGGSCWVPPFGSRSQPFEVRFFFLFSPTPKPTLELTFTSFSSSSSFLLTFALAELYESLKGFPKTHLLFTNLLNRLQPTLERTKASIKDEIAAAIASVIDTTATIKRTTGNHLITDPSEPDLAEVKRALEEERKTKAEEVKVRRERETEEMEKGVALAWIMYMRFARRAEVRFPFHAFRWFFKVEEIRR